MELFNKKIGVVFLKESSEAELFIEKMNVLKDKASGDFREEIEKQIKLANYGLNGEKQVAYELKNSGMDMYVLHDISLEVGSLTAQIDYIVITRKYIYILECKNLIGNIEIDKNGSFIRTYELFGKKIKEGIYSPITQNRRHLDILKEIRKSSKTNVLSKLLFDMNFDNTYKSLVILANSKTYLNDRFAPKEIKNQVLRVDRLVAYLKEQYNESKESDMSNEQMKRLAEFFLEKSSTNKSDYTKRYEEIIESMSHSCVTHISNKSEIKSTAEKIDNEKRETLRAVLKKFRLEQSRKENIKPFYIFNDAQLDNLLNAMPKTKEELLTVSGFGAQKVEKYGERIISILWN